MVQVGETQVESPQNVIHEALERLGGVVQKEGHEWELEEAERSCNNGLLDIIGMDGDLVIGSHQVDFGKDGATEKLVGVVVDMADGVAVGNGPGIQRSVLSAWAPTVVLLGFDVEGGRPGALVSASGAFSQHGVELGFGDGEPVRCQSPWSACDEWAWYSSDVVNDAVAYFAPDSGRLGQVRELVEEAVARIAASNGLYAWDL
jgi:hypothetical protein